MADETGQTLVLIVDDCPGDRALCRALLTEGGAHAFSFLEAETAAGGLELCGSADPACVIVDYGLPDLDGIQFLARLAGADGAPAVPAVVLTGHGDERVAVQAMKTGAKDYLSKGKLTPEALHRAVWNAIEKGRLERDIRAHQAELERLNRDLSRKNRDIQSFYHTVSHELKTPLSVIREFSLILIDGLAGPINGEQRAYLGIVRKNCDQMTAMINDLLDSSRLENGKLTIHPEPTAVGELLRTVATQMKPLAGERGIAIRCEVPPDLPEVWVDSCRIQEVVTNLLSNAIKFTPPEGGITVTAAVEGESGTLRIAVRDTGVGIEPDQLSRVFERFHQVRNPDTEGMGGLGLGLNICKGLVELHGGRMEVASVPGEGSTFSFTLPMTRKEAVIT